MSKPTILSGRFEAGKDFECGRNVVIKVAEECVLGDRVTLADNTYIEGRSVRIGDDFYGYSWGHPNPPQEYAGQAQDYPFKPSHEIYRDIPGVFGRWLEIGRGRIDEEHSVLTVGSRCTFHDNRIDLARRVTIGDDVGLSPEVVIYTHGYWMSCLKGFPYAFEDVYIGPKTIIGFRSTILAGAKLPERSVFAAGSVVVGKLHLPIGLYAGCPAKFVKAFEPLHEDEVRRIAVELKDDYLASLAHRNLPTDGLMLVQIGSPYECRIRWRGFNVPLHPVPRIEGEEDEYSDDLRWFLFTRGIRIYTQRRFKKMPRGTK